jgi:hypothetical protein
MATAFEIAYMEVSSPIRKPVMMALTVSTPAVAA